ncbi:MAG TPA: hypothetical protein VIU12_01300 [Chryseolinea sp.]
MENSDEGKKTRRQSDSIYYEWERKRFPSATFDLLPIGTDSLIASTRYNGIIFTSNAGQTWTTISSPGTICKLATDSNKDIWGLYSWQGIHEADRSILYSSSDFGKTWQAYELNTSEVFPADFYSQSNSQLRIIDYECKIYELTKETPGLHWKLVDSLKEKQKLSPWWRRGFVTDSRKRHWTFNDQGIFLSEQDTIKVY